MASTGKLVLVHSLGADQLIDYLTSDFADGPVKYDLILDIGGNPPLGRLRRALTQRAAWCSSAASMVGDWT